MKGRQQGATWRSGYNAARIFAPFCFPEPPAAALRMTDLVIPTERFAGVERLYGVGTLEKLARAHVCVIGIGGVGSWAAEALARSGVGRLTLIDADEVCVSNTNRQLHALEGEYGKPKVGVIAERAHAI